MRHEWYRLVLCSILSLGGTMGPDSPVGAEVADAPPKMLIEWGWDEPDTKFMREHVEQMEQYPFDGLVFHVNSSKGGNLTWEMWGDRKFQWDEFQHAVDDLQATRFQKLRENFLRVNVSPGKVDWFDDAAWSTVLHNYALASRIAKEGGCRGFMFDVEQYNEGLYDYAQQPHRETRSFADFQQQVRVRGRQWMEIVNQHYPDITILLTFGYRIAQPTAGDDRSPAHYGLLADFLDGMLDACSPGTKLVDAWEFAYPYKRREQFEEGYQTIKAKSLEWTRNAPKYQQHVTAGFGLWMDCRWREVGWNTNDFSQNHFSPEEFQQTLHYALQTSDRYVWIYTEQPRWWPADKLPQPYVDAVRQAKRATVAGSLSVECEGRYPQHLQGVCCDGEDSLYWSFTSQLVRTDLTGKVIRTIDVPSHHGDLCYGDQRVYVAVNLGKFNEPAGAADSWVYVYDADSLQLLSRHELPQVVHGAGGMELRDGRFFVVGGLPKDVAENYVYEYDAQWNFQGRNTINSGSTLMGIQTAAFADGCWWFGCYGKPPVTLQCDARLQLRQKFEFDCALGIAKGPAGRFYAARGDCQAGRDYRGWIVPVRVDTAKGLVVLE